jgi:hypothetical protein
MTTATATPIDPTHPGMEHVRTQIRIIRALAVAEDPVDNRTRKNFILAGQVAHDLNDLSYKCTGVPDEPKYLTAYLVALTAFANLLSLPDTEWGPITIHDSDIAICYAAEDMAKMLADCVGVDLDEVAA